MTQPLKVTLIVDREDRHHAEFWTEILKDLSDRGIVQSTLKLFPLADKLTAPLTDEPVLLELIEHGSDVLIINWDAVNGDPDFGGDVALRWFEHRQFALRRWIRQGGMLIFEGQAAQGVPDDRYYSAVLGEGEVRLSGREDPLDPDAERRRMVGDARMTRIAKKATGFEGLEQIASRRRPSFDLLFPKEHAGRLVPSYLRSIDTDNLLYRGWFRRRLRRGGLNWVPYIRRAKRWPQNFAVMLVAKCGKGAIFVTTILLSATDQRQLIQAMLLTHGRVESLPEPAPLRRAVYRYALKAATGLLTGLLIYLVGTPDKVVVPVVAGLVVTILIDQLPSIWRGAVHVVRKFTGA